MDKGEFEGKTVQPATATSISSLSRVHTFCKLYKLLSNNSSIPSLLSSCFSGFYSLFGEK